MKDVRIVAAIPPKAENCVLKNKGIIEKYNHEKNIKILSHGRSPIIGSRKITSQVSKLPMTV